MGSFTAGSVVLVRFPFSDLSQSTIKRIADVIVHLLQAKK